MTPPRRPHNGTSTHAARSPREVAWENDPGRQQLVLLRPWVKGIDEILAHYQGVFDFAFSARETLVRTQQMRYDLDAVLEAPSPFVDAGDPG